jgi:hypothetical protein
MEQIEGGALVTVDKSMVCRHGVHKSHGFLMNSRVVSRIGAGDGGFNSAQILDLNPSAKSSYGAVVSGNCIAKRYPVMTHILLVGQSL